MTSIQLDHIYQMLFQTAAEGLIVTNSKGEIIVSNPRISEMFQYSKDELQLQKVEILIPKQYHKNHVGHREGYHQNPQKRTMGIGMNLTGARKDGSVFPVEVSLNHFEVQGEKYVMALISDITERKKAEDQVKQVNEDLERRVEERTAELKQSQLLHNLMARNFPNGTINVFDKELNYVFVEGQDLYKHGITSEKLIGTPYLARLDGSIKETIESHLRQAFEGVNSTFELEFQHNHYQISAVGLLSEEGNIDQILVVEQNITEQKEAAEQMREALSKERELNELKSRFVSMASHEFRTPLSTILSSASLIQRYELPEQTEKREQHINRIKSSVHNLTSILNDFLSIDKLEAGKVDLRLQRFSPSELFHELKEEIETVAKQGQLIRYSEDQLPTEIETDKQILRNIITNLLSNAIKYSEKDIEFQAGMESDTLKLSVKDFGIGIPKEEQQHIFERLFRANNVTNIQGTGLGLNIVSKYLKLLDGNISFTSEYGKGTEFNVEIPLKS